MPSLIGSKLGRNTALSEDTEHQKQTRYMKLFLQNIDLPLISRGAEIPC